MSVKPVIGITMGDPAGIGAELVCKAAASGFLNNGSIPVIVGEEALLRRGMKHTGTRFEYRIVDSVKEAAGGGPVALLPYGNLDIDQVKIGRETEENGTDQGNILVECIRLCQTGELDGFCFAPLNKAAMKKGGYQYPSEHEMFADIYGQQEGFGEMNYLNGLWNIRVTSHIPFREVADEITVENILKTARLGYSTLRRAGCSHPQILVAALNPHSGENGTCGREESEIICPAIERARREGMSLEGPFSADTLFGRAFEDKKDGVITMYHDQGQIAIKLQNFMHCVTISAGLPHPITTPAHGTAYDIAGTGTCRITPFKEAFRLCCRMAKGDLIAKQVVV